MRRRPKIALAVGGTLMVALIGAGCALYVAGNTAAGRRFLERATRAVTGGRVDIRGLGGAFPAHLTAAQLILRDKQGVWLTADRLALDWRPLSLFGRTVRIDDLRAARVVLTRLPATAHGAHRPPPSIPHIDVARASIGRFELGSALVGRPATLAVHGTLRLHSLQNLYAQVDAVRLDGAGRYELRLAFDPVRVAARLTVQEPAGGPLESLLQLPDLGGLAATFVLGGPRQAERLDLRVHAGALRALARGRVNLPAQSAVVVFSLEAAAMSPRPGLAWQSVAASGHWRGSLQQPVADGKFDIRELRLGGAATIAELRAVLTGGAGKLGVRGALSGLRIAGPQPDLFGRGPMSFDALFSPKLAHRPLTFDLQDSRLALRGRIATTAPEHAVLHLDVPQIAPFAALAGQSVRGRAAIKIDLQRRSAGVGFSLGGSVAGLGGAGWVAALGAQVSLRAVGSVGVRHIALSQLQVAGRAWTLSANGTAVRASASLRAHWTFDAANLAVFSPLLAGTLHASGAIDGPPGALAADARLISRVAVHGSTPLALTASLHTGGPEAAGRGSLRVAGTFDAAPLRLALLWRPAGNGGIQAVIRQGDWKSVRLAGAFALDRTFAVSDGRVSLDIGTLADLDHLTGLDLRGRLAADGSFGTFSGRRRLTWHATVPDLEIGRFAAAVEASASGPLDGLNLHLEARLPDVGGAAATIASTAMLQLANRQLHISALALGYRGQSAHLLAPADLTYGAAVSIAGLRLGLGGATLQLAGRIAPTLELQASLDGAAPKLVDLIAPGLLARGRIAASASLRGPPGAPTGQVRWDASGMRSADALSLGLPAVDFRGEARLDGDSAQVAAELRAGAKSQLTVAGRVPLRAGAPLALKVAGTMNLGLAAPALEARGIYASGALQVAVSLSGETQAPRIAGTLRLSGGHLQDYVRGINLENIDTRLVGDGDVLVIESFTASLPPGKVSITGRIGPLGGDLPLDLHIVATNARPIDSNLITANLDADLHVTGTARRRIELAGTIHVHRAVIGIPNALPPNVAVLDVRRPGQAAAPAAARPVVVALRLNVDAPRQILVRGRGLDAELGGDLRLAGTVDTPQVAGGFDLQRGSVDLAGSRLSFKSGHVGFNGAGLRHRIDPTIDFVAQSSSANVQATLRITGLADAPRFELTSIPPMPPDEILRDLLFGVSNPTQLSALQAAQIGAALATLSGVAGEGLNPLSKLQRALGLDRLSVGAAPTTGAATSRPASTGASIAAGRYISPRVYLEALQTTTGLSQLQISVDLTRHLKLQSRLGNGAAITQGTTPENDPGSSIGLSYQFEY